MLAEYRLGKDEARNLNLFFTKAAAAIADIGHDYLLALGTEVDTSTQEGWEAAFYEYGIALAKTPKQLCAILESLGEKE